MPVKCAMLPTLLGRKIPNKSRAAQIAAAKTIGIGKPPGPHTIIRGLIKTKAPMMPNIAPEAPKDAG